MAIPQKDLESALEKKFPQDTVVVKDLVGDGDHYAVEIISTQFNGLRLVQRHRLVYEALGDMVGTTLHALTLKLYSPDEKKDA